MSETYTHACIKCGTKYQDQDPDPYYCGACKSEKDRIAQEVDAKMANRKPSQAKSGLQEYDEAEKVGGFMHIRL